MWRSKYVPVRNLGGSADSIETWLVKEATTQELGLLKSSGSQAWRLKDSAKLYQKLAAIGFGIPRLREFWETEDQACLVLDWIEGKSWAEASRTEIVASLPAVARILAEVHALGLWHADIKPDHILLTADGSPVLTDFGLCLQDATQSVLTPEYAAPEQLGGTGGPSSDLFALARTLQKLLPRSPELEPLFEKCLNPDPNHRPSSQLFGQLLESALESMTPQPFQGEVPFEGRTDILEQLQLCLASAVQGLGGFISLGGLSGMGKSRLLRHFLSQSGATALWGGFYEGDRPQTYGALREAFAQLSPESANHQSMASHHKERLVAAFPELAWLLDSTPTRVSELKARQQELLIESLGYFLQSLGSAEQPVVLVLDDLQWADGDSLRLLERVSQTPSQHCMVIVSFRSDEFEPGDGFRFMNRLQLEPLELEDAQRLAQRITGKGDPDLAQRGHQWSQGNAFFLLEFLRSGGDQFSAQAWLHLQRKIDSLNADTKLVLAACALLGRSFDLIELGQLFPQLDMDAILAEAVEQRVIHIQGSRGSFVHDRLREASAQCGDQEQCHTWHGQLAQIVTSQARKGYHLFQSGNLQAAHPVLLEVAQAAKAELSLPNARRYYEMALQCAPLIETRLELQRVLRGLGLKDKALEHIEIALFENTDSRSRLSIYHEALMLCADWADVAGLENYWTARRSELGYPENSSYWRVIKWHLTLPRPQALTFLSDWRITQNFKVSGNDWLGFLGFATLSVIHWKILDAPTIYWLCIIFEHFRLGKLSKVIEDKLDFDSKHGIRTLSNYEESLVQAMRCVRGLAETNIDFWCAHLHQYSAPLLSQGQGFDRLLFCMVRNWFSVATGSMDKLSSDCSAMLEEAERDSNPMAGVLASYALALTLSPISKRQEYWMETLATDSVVLMRQCQFLAIQATQIGSFERAYSALQSSSAFLPREILMSKTWQTNLCRVAAETLPRSATSKRKKLLQEAQTAITRALRYGPMMRLYHVHALREMGLLKLALGDPVAGDFWLRRSLREAIECGQVFQECLTRRELARVGQLLGCPGTQEHHRRATQLAESMSAPWLIPADTLAPRLEAVRSYTKQLLQGRQPSAGLQPEGFWKAEQLRDWERFCTIAAAAGQASIQPEGHSPTSQNKNFLSLTPESTQSGSTGFYRTETAIFEKAIQRLLVPNLPAQVKSEIVQTLSPLPNLDNLVAPFRRLGLKISLPSRRPNWQRLTPQASQAAQAFIREGCNNAVKHAAGQRVYLSIRETPDNLWLILSNDRPPNPLSPSSTSKGRFGLKSLQWRASSVGGELTIHRQPDLWQLRLRLPLTRDLNDRTSLRSKEN